MGIYKVIYETNKENKNKIAVSIRMDNGDKREYSYGELFEKADIFVERLKNSNVIKGDRVIILAENSPEWNIAYLAIMKMKCTAVLIDSTLSNEEILKLIKQSDARCIFSSPKVISKIGVDSSITIPILNIMDNANTFEGSISKVSEENKGTIDGNEDIALIIFSSGTTKSASGIMHSHEAMINSIKMTSEQNKINDEDRILSILPNTHIYGVVTCLLGSMMLGGRLHYIDSLNSENLLTAFKEFKPTIFPAVPKVYELFERQIVKKIESNVITKYIFKVFLPLCKNIRKLTGLNIGKKVFSSIHKGFGGELRLMPSAGAALDEKVAEFYYSTGFNILITYGLTETNIPVIGNRGDNITTDSCGKVYSNIEVKIANKDESGAGEIYVKSPYMMQGYFRDEEATKEAFDGEWFKTGDIAILDKKSNIKIVGRSKENIVLATGKKVTPTDVENKYGSIEGVKELVICGVPVNNGEYDEVHAFIVKENKKFDSNKILKEIQERGAKLSLYMKIAKVHFVEDIPKTSLQKPKRYLLKKFALDNTIKVVSEEKVIDVKRNFCDITSEVIDIIIKIGKLDNKLVDENSKIFSELGIDSLGAIEISAYVEERWGVDISSAFYENITISEIVENIKNPKENKRILVDFYLKRKESLHYNIFKFNCGLAHILYKIKVIDKENIPSDSGYIICANHVSNIDYLWIAIEFKKKQFSKLCCMAKKELFNDSFASKLLTDVCGMIPVDRGNVSSELINFCKEKLNDKWGMIIHPEGTRSDNGELGSFKKGAAKIAKEANVPIIPTYIKGAYEIYPKGRSIPKLFNWEKLKRYEVDIIYGEPIYPNNLTEEELTELVKEAVATLKSKLE